MSPASLIAELQRRNVHRAAIFYAGASWLLMQVASQILPFFDIPNWAVRTVVIGLLVGFPFAMLFSWYFEWTPQGIRRESEIAPGTSVTRQTGRTMDRWIIVVLGLAVAVLLLNQFVLHRFMPGAETSSDAAGDKSIAVLPFTNMSGDAANEYFSDGISEEILNVLARTPDLHVAARTSSFSFKGRTVEIPEIARALKVRMVLEGSVRKQGERVRITAQLIDSTTGFHVWSQTYDRKLQDIFAIQDEIAKAIGDELEVKLAAAPATGKPSAGTSNLEAYDLFLRGIALWQTRRGDAIWESIKLFEQAATADPQFADGYAGEAMAYAIVADYSDRIPYAESLARARDWAERALVLDSQLPETYAALGIVASKELRRGTAEMLLRRAIALRPSFATAYQWLGSLLMSNGDLTGALAMLERASELDPRALVVAENHSFILQTLGRYDDSKALCLRTLEFAPTYAGCLEDVSFANLLLGDLDGARITLDRLAAAVNPSAATQGRKLADALAGKGDRHALALYYAALSSSSAFDQHSGNTLEAYQIPGVLMLLGEYELALRYLETLSTELGGTADWAVMLPMMDPIRCEPRFIAVIQRLKTSDPYAAKVCAGKN